MKAPGYGFLGVGEVTGPSQSAADYTVNLEGEERPALEVLTKAGYHREYVDDPERAEYFVPVKRLHTVPLDRAVNEIGLFGNQNTVCKPTTPKWRSTVERLKERWPEVA